MASAPLKHRAIAKQLATFRRDGRRQLSEPETKDILALAGFNIPKETLAHSQREAVRAASALGFPAVMKIVSPDILHKSDVGGVRVGLDSESAVRKAYSEMMDSVRRKAAGARIDGVSVQQQVRGLEVILGLATDPQFGPILMFGLGGVFVEVLEDVVFRVVPLSEQDAGEMIAEIKGAPLLKGFRGAPPASERSLISAILRLSELAASFHDTIREIDINPLVLTPNNAFAVDGVLTTH